MGFQEIFDEIAELTDSMMAEGNKAAEQERGYKNAHKEFRKLSLALGKKLVEARKLSVEASR